MTSQRGVSLVVLLTLETALLTNACTAAGGLPRAATATTADEAAILQLISEHYVAAVFQNRDAASVRRGFHPDFHLFVLDDGEIIVAPLEMWLERPSAPPSALPSAAPAARDDPARDTP